MSKTVVISLLVDSYTRELSVVPIFVSVTSLEEPTAVSVADSVVSACETGLDAVESGEDPTVNEVLLEVSSEEL
jgi:hypothetical protein